MVQDHDAAIKTVSRWFKSRGHEPLIPRKQNSNGADLVVVSKNKIDVWKVEVKTLKKKINGTYQISPLSKQRSKDDFLFIADSEKILWYGTLSDHLKCCSNSGFRAVTSIMKLWL